MKLLELLATLKPGDTFYLEKPRENTSPIYIIREGGVPVFRDGEWCVERFVSYTVNNAPMHFLDEEIEDNRWVKSDKD